MIAEGTGKEFNIQLREKWQRTVIITMFKYIRTNTKDGEELLKVIKSYIIMSNWLKLEEGKLI